METRLLQYFLAVAQEQNFSRAADVLHTSQPNLSKQLSDLESQLGKQLLIRGSRHVTLTEEGQLLKERAQEILSLIQQTTTDVQTLNRTITGTIRLGSVTPHLLSSLAPIMQTIRQNHPGISFDLTTTPTDPAHLDFLFTTTPEENALPLHLTETTGVLMHADNPLASHTAISADDIKGAPFWLTRQQVKNHPLADWLGFSPENLDTLGICDSPESAAAMITAGMGVAFTSPPQTGISSAPLIWRPLNPPLEQPVYVTWSRKQPLSKAAALFLETLQEASNRPNKPNTVN